MKLIFFFLGSIRLHTLCNKHCPKSYWIIFIKLLVSILIIDQKVI